MSYSVGQTLWYVPRTYGTNSTGHRVTVTKIGCRWVELSNSRRVELGSRDVDGGDYSSPGSVWPSEEDWRGYVETQAAWNSLAEDMRRAPPNSITTAIIEQVRKLLGLSK